MALLAGQSTLTNQARSQKRQIPGRRAIVTLPIYHLIPNAPKPVAPYSHVVEADGWLFVTGQLATDPDDDSLPLPEGIEAQTRKVMDNLKRALAGAGAGFEHVVYVRIFLTDFERDYAAFNRLYAEYFEPDRLPARTTVGVTHLARSGIVEVDLIARRS
jgi:2-iminobutanoate/2-iminopropanoate deaminase